MKIDGKLWKQTTIESMLSSFPGVLGEFLQETTPQDILRAEKYLAHIFWRWYMLEHPTQHSSPYYFLHWRREKERWPEDGQFFPKPTLSITKETDPFLPTSEHPTVQITLTVDYIAFNEQPLIIDVISSLRGKPQRYHYDQNYDDAISVLTQFCRKEGLTPNTLKKNPLPLLNHYFSHTLLAWYKTDQFISTAFTETDWFAFWKTILELSERKDGLSTDHLLDDFVDIVRLTHRDYGIKSADLENVNGPGDIDIQVKIQYFFWLSLAYHVLLPFSFYTHLVAPIFVTQDMFHNDVQALITEDFTEPMPIYAPFTTLTLTPFGERFLKKLTFKM